MTAPVTHSLVKALRNVHAFRGLDDATLLTIVGTSANLAYAEGAGIFEAQSPSDALYVILGGRVRIFGDDGDDVAELGRGESFGEISLLRRTSHTKSAQALEPTELMVVPRDAFEELLERNGELRAHLEQHIARREGVRGDVSESVED